MFQVNNEKSEKVIVLEIQFCNNGKPYVSKHTTYLMLLYMNLKMNMHDFVDYRNNNMMHNNKHLKQRRKNIKLKT